MRQRQVGRIKQTSASARKTPLRIVVFIRSRDRTITFIGTTRQQLAGGGFWSEGWDGADLLEHG